MTTIHYPTIFFILLHMINSSSAICGLPKRTIHVHWVNFVTNNNQRIIPSEISFTYQGLLDESLEIAAAKWCVQNKIYNDACQSSIVEKACDLGTNSGKYHGTLIPVINAYAAPPPNTKHSVLIHPKLNLPYQNDPLRLHTFEDTIEDAVIQWGYDLHQGPLLNDPISLYLDAVERLILALPYSNKCSYASDIILTTVTKKQRDAFNKAKGGPFPYCRLTMCPACLSTTKHLLLNHIVLNNISGDFIEAGTWRGGQSILALATLHVTNSLKHRKVIVADSFQGLPRPMHSEDLKDEFNNMLHQEKEHVVSVNDVKSNFINVLGARLIVDENVQFVQGFFNVLLPKMVQQKLDGKEKMLKIAFLRFDGGRFNLFLEP